MSARSHMSRTDSSIARGTPPVRSCRKVRNSSETGSPPSIDDTSDAVSSGATDARAILDPVTPTGRRDVSRSSSDPASTSSGR